MKAINNIRLNKGISYCLCFFIFFVSQNIYAQVVLTFKNGVGDGAYIGGGTGAGTVGAVYQWLGVATELGVTIDANIKITSIFGGATLTTIDGNSTASDWEPQISGPVTTNGNSYGIEFQVDFFNHATSLPYNLTSFLAQAIDVDGGGTGSALREYTVFNNPNSYTLETPTSLTASNVTGGYKFQSGQAGYNGINIAITQCIVSCAYTNINSFKLTCGVAAVGGSCSGNRMFSLNFRNIVSFSSPASTLPIELISFNGKSIGYGRVLIEWVTASEKNNDYFTLERLDDEKNVEVITTIKGMGTSYTSIVYNTYDYSAEHKTVYYRLKQTDLNGEFTFSNIISVDNTDDVNPIVTKINLMGNEVVKDEKGLVIVIYENNQVFKTIQK